MSMLELKKPVAQPTEEPPRTERIKPKIEETRKFGKEVMGPEWKIGDWPIKAEGHKASYEKEVWLSKKKFDTESVVRIDVFLHEGKPDHFTVSEIKEGKLLRSEFNSLLEPVAGGTSPASLLKEHGVNLEGFMKDEFFKHAMDRTKEVPTTVKVQGVGLEHRFVYLSKKIVSGMQLGYKTSCKLEEGGDSEGNYLRMTPEEITMIQVRVRKGATSYFVTIPKDMLFIAGLKSGDHITWSLEEGRLFLRKAEGSDEDARKVIRSAIVIIPEEFVEKFGLKKGDYGIWTFDEDEKEKPRLWLELSKDNPHIVHIVAISSMQDKKYLNEFCVSIPDGLGEWLKARDEVILEPKEGKLYIRKKQS